MLAKSKQILLILIKKRNVTAHKQFSGEIRSLTSHLQLKSMNSTTRGAYLSTRSFLRSSSPKYIELEFTCFLFRF